MKKLVKRIGNSKGITFSIEERKILDIDIGDIVEVNKEDE
jgi:antitoxin component of MazEF toxin-antitoxin module